MIIVILIVNLKLLLFLFIINFIWTQITIVCYYLHNFILLIGPFSYDISHGNSNKMGSATITGGKIEASRMIEYLYQLTHSLPLDGSIIPNEIR